jgi:hypothetical protein
MTFKIVLARALVSVALLALLMATSGGEALAEQTGSPAITSDSVNLSGKDFFHAYASQDRSESEKARLYMLGVSDSSEGRVWCDYRHFSTTTLQEFVYEYFKKLPEHRLDQRASTLIQEALKTNFRCKDKR